jgi:hypothetical protein
MRCLLNINDMRICNNVVVIKTFFGFFLSLALAPLWVNAQSIHITSNSEFDHVYNLYERIRGQTLGEDIYDWEQAIRTWLQSIQDNSCK